MNVAQPAMVAWFEKETACGKPSGGLASTQPWLVALRLPTAFLYPKNLSERRKTNAPISVYLVI
jgi:hypothetical protein